MSKNRSGTMEKIFEIIAQSLSEFFQTKYIAFFQLNPSRDELILKYASGFHPESLENLRQVKLAIHPFRKLLEEKESQIENEIFKNEKELAFLVKMDGLESMIGVPLFTKGNIWGILLVFSQERHRFKKQDGEILNLWGKELADFQDLFSSSLQTKLSGDLAKILGDIEILKSSLRDKKTIPASEILDALEHLENMALQSSQKSEQFQQEWTLEERSKEKLKEETLAEEVIVIEGERMPFQEKRKVLIVDDQPIITDLLVDILNRMGYSSEVALGGKDGLRIFAENDFDLVITDLGMPDVSGWEVSRSVKKQNPSVPVILITGWGVDPDPQKLKNSGIDFVVNKPFHIDHLERTIRDLVDRKRTID
jgi:CheY-like chemotaxis protein/putative methionine-R-sulfoxide reductase with GAF domain